MYSYLLGHIKAGTLGKNDNVKETTEPSYIKVKWGDSLPFEDILIKMNISPQEKGTKLRLDARAFMKVRRDAAKSSPVKLTF